MTATKRIKRRRRRLAFERNNLLFKKSRLCLSTIMIAMIIVVTAGMAISNQVSAAEEDKFEFVEVQYGDTIWEIADKYNPDNISIRSYAYEICEINDIEDYKVYPGQIIKIKIN